MTKGQLKRLAIAAGVTIGIAAAYFGGVGVAYAAGSSAANAWALGMFAFPALMAAGMLSAMICVGLADLVDWIRRG